jgi:putative FmdB family regulatory protein
VPTYQYACTECDEQLEVRQSFTDDALTVCPRCEGRLRKIFNAVGVVFKGSGFYKTDSRKPEPSASGSGESGSKDSGSKDSSSKDSGGKDSGSKNSGAKESGSKDSSAGKGSGDSKNTSGSGGSGKTSSAA